MTRALFARIASADVRAVALALLLVLSVPAGSVGAIATAQSGPIEISTVDELQAMSDDPTADYVLVNDIDARETKYWENPDLWNEPTGFVPIEGFTGTFDGNGHTIDGLHIGQNADDGIGLFSDTNGATIQNLVLEDIDYFLDGGNELGGLVGTATDTDISDVYVDGTLNGSNKIGGIAGTLVSGNITDSGAEVTIKSDGQMGGGGLVGVTGDGTAGSEVRIVRSYAAGDVTMYGDAVGALVGDSTAGSLEVTESYASGSVMLTGGSGQLGSIAGQADNISITDSITDATLAQGQSGSAEIGGIVGTASGSLEAVNTVSATSYDRYEPADPSTVSGVTSSSGTTDVSATYWAYDLFPNETDGSADGTDIGDSPLTSEEMTGADAEENMPELAYGDVWELDARFPSLTAITYEHKVFEQELRLHDFTETFDPEFSQAILETEGVDGWDTYAVDQFGPENRAQIEVVEGQTYRVTVTNQNGDKYVWGDRMFFAPFEIETEWGTTSVGGVNTIYIGSGSEITSIGNDDDGPTWVDRDPGPGDDFNQPPIATFNADPLNPVVDESISFDASGSTDVDGDIVSYDWTFDDGTTATGEVVSHSFSENGTHDVALEVEDNTGGTATWEMGVYVAADANDTSFPPEAEMTIVPETAETGELVTFDGSRSWSYDGEIVEYNWQIGDVEREGRVVEESFGGAGIKEVKLTVVDDNGAYQSVTSEVIVYEDTDEKSAVVGAPLEPGDGILPGSLTSLWLLIVGGVVTVVGLVWVDSKTETDIPTWVVALPAGAVGFMVVEAAAPGTITLPIMRALDVVGPLLIIGALAIVYLLFRGWRDARAADRIESLQGR